MQIGISPPPRLAPDICRGRNEYGGVYSAPPPPDSRRRIPASPPSFPRTRESVKMRGVGKRTFHSRERGNLYASLCDANYHRFTPPRRRYFSPPNPRLPAVIPANAGIHFHRQTPAFTSFFAKKMRGNSKLNFRVKFAEIPKLISPNRFPLSRE